MSEPEAAGAAAGAEAGLSPADALEIAVRAHRSGDGELAAKLYARILAVAPDYADALHFYGVLHHQAGSSREAVRLIRRAIEIEPDDPGMHVNLGNVLLQLDRYDLAMQAYRMAIVLEPGHVDARNNLGVALRALRRPDEAEEVYREAIALDPDHRESWDNLGRLLSSRGRIQEAIACHARALELEPRNADTRRFLVAAYAATDEKARALAILREWLADEPASPSAQHLHAAISGENVPERAGDRYVAALFDGFAQTFDDKLTRLDYRAPDLVAAAVAAAYGAPRAGLSVLDAGCGTGLCAPALRPFAAQLVGVDLSGGMLDRAKARGGYDRLVQAELGDHLRENPNAFDLIACADTLCYFGPLDELLGHAAAALKPGGRIVFSVEEETAEAGFRINPHGRYSHRADYVRETLRGAGFEVEALDRDSLRMERGKPVPGLIATARRG